MNMSEKVEVKKTLTLTGITVNAMALIAPGAFLWLTFQMQAAQVNGQNETTAMDMFAGLVLALILAFLTAVSYSKLSEKYPEAGSGSSYYFAEHAFMNDPSRLSFFSRVAKDVVGWFSHIYYWVYPGVMVAMMATLITYILGQFGITISIPMRSLIAVIFAVITGFVAYRGINGSTFSSLIINVIQITTLVFLTILALIYRIQNPQHVQFVHKTLVSIVAPHSFSNILFQATISILLLVGFESATAFAGEAKSPKSVSKGVILSLVFQGLIFYLLEYFGTNAWLNTSYKVGGKAGIQAAAASDAPIGDMARTLGDSLLNHSGFMLMIIVAVTVVIAVFGSTLACMNTGVRITYAMAKDEEMPSVLGVLDPKYATPHVAVVLITIISAFVGAVGTISVTNLSTITLVSNIGTFVLYGMTNLISFVAFRKDKNRSIVFHIIVPIFGFLANLSMLLSVLYLGILGGGTTKISSILAVLIAAIWGILGVIYLLVRSRKNKIPIFIKA